MMDSNVKLEKISYERILWYLSHGMYGYHIMWDSDLLRPSHKILSWNWDNVSSLIPATNQVHQKRLHYKLIIIIIIFFFFFKTIFKQWVLLGSLFMFVGQQIALSTMLLIRPFLVLMRLGLFPSPIFGPIHLKRTLEFGWVIVLSFNTPTHTHTRVLLAWEFWWLTRHIWYIRPMACRHEPMGMLHYCCQIVHGPNLQEFALIRSESLCHIYILKIKIQLIVQIIFFSSKKKKKKNSH